MKNTIISISLLLCFELSVSAQWIKKDMVINDVIRIEEKNVAHIENKYLIDLPLFINRGNLTIYNNSSLPNELFFNPDLNLSASFILISPYKTKGNKNRLKYYRVKIMYYDTRSSWASIDSISFPENKSPKLNFYSFETDTTKIIPYFISDYHGSVVFEDENAFKSTIPSQIASFENKYEVKISTEVLPGPAMGLEGEHETYYILKGLSLEQTLQFLLEKNYYPFKNLIIPKWFIERKQKEVHN